MTETVSNGRSALLLGATGLVGGHCLRLLLADGRYRHALATMFKGDYDAIQVMKWRDIIDNLEAATDRCEDVANILEGIVLEYS